MKNIKDIRTIIILNVNAVSFDDTLLFEYSGNIKRITNATVSGFKTKEFVPNIVEYDLTNIPASKSETKPEDDSIILKESEEIIPLPKLNNRSTLESLTISTKLPSDYMNNKDYLIEDELKIKNTICGNCDYFHHNYCDLWDSPVNQKGWCESWKSKYEQFEVQEEINEL